MSQIGPSVILCGALCEGFFCRMLFHGGPQTHRYGMKSCLYMPRCRHLAWNWHLSRPPVYCLEWQQIVTSGLLASAASRRVNASAWNCAVLFGEHQDGSCRSVMHSKQKKKKGEFTVLNIDISLSILSTTTAEKSLKPILIPVESSAADKDGCNMLLRARYMFLFLFFFLQNSKQRN